MSGPGYKTKQREVQFMHCDQAVKNDLSNVFGSISINILSQSGCHCYQMGNVKNV